MFRKVMKFLKIFVLVCLVLAFITGYKYQKEKIKNEKVNKEIQITDNDISKNNKKSIESKKEEKIKDKEEVKEEVKEKQDTNNITKSNEKKVSNNTTKSNKVETNNNKNNNEVKVENKNNNNNEIKTETVEQPVQENTSSNTNNTTTTSNTSSALDEAFSKHTCSYSIYKENGVEKEYNSFSECTSDYGKVLGSADSAMCYTSGYDQDGNEKFKMQICYK